MKIKLDKFCLSLKEVESEAAVDDSDVSPYLLDNLLYPFLNGEDIALSDLDYDAFSLDELDDLFEFISDMQSVCHKTEGKANGLQKSAPTARTLRAFC